MHILQIGCTQFHLKKHQFNLRLIFTFDLVPLSQVGHFLLILTSRIPHYPSTWSISLIWDGKWLCHAMEFTNQGMLRFINYDKAPLQFPLEAKHSHLVSHNLYPLLMYICEVIFFEPIASSNIPFVLQRY